MNRMFFKLTIIINQIKLTFIASIHGVNANWDKLYLSALSRLITDGQNCGCNELNFDWHNQATNQLIWGLIKGLSRRDNKKRDHARYQLQLNLLHFHGGLAVEVYFPHLRIPSLALACPLLTSTSSTGTLHFCWSITHTFDVFLVIFHLQIVFFFF